MVTKQKQSADKKTLNNNEIIARNINLLKNVTILEKQVNSIDPNNVNDLF